VLSISMPVRRRARAEAPRRRDVRVRLSPGEADLIREAARREGLSVGAWVGEVAVRAARTDASPLPATWRELVAALVQLRAEVVGGQRVPIVQLGPPVDSEDLLRHIDESTAVAVAAARFQQRRERPKL
jgi:hypothetical protein